jgi:hypothetical protein
MEALKVIASAWSVAFIIMFVIFQLNDLGKSHPILWLFLLTSAVTGSGWLTYRAQSKEPESASKGHENER